MKSEGLDKGKFQFINLFCGAGGGAYGLTKIGGQCLLGLDSDPDSVKTFAQNIEGSECFCGDISELTVEVIKAKVGQNLPHIVVGGPQCQNINLTNLNEEQNEFSHALHEYCRVLSFLKPDYIFFDNVPGVLAKRNRKNLDAILKIFASCGYHFEVQMLESQHYGVPQRRKRAMFLGSRFRHELTFPSSTYDTIVNGEYVPPKTVGDALSILDRLKQNGTFLPNSETKHTGLLRQENIERLKYIPEGRGIRYKKDEEELLPEHLRLGIKWESIRENRLRELRFYRLDRSRPAPTINVQNPQYFHPTENRRFTVRELASFHSFPHTYNFHGVYRSQVRQIGNAMPPLVAQAMGIHIQGFYQANLHQSEVYRPQEQGQQQSYEISSLEQNQIQ